MHFFDVYQQLDARTAPPNADLLGLDQRHHTAAYAAAAAAVGIDAIVTNASTVGRSDVADNDVVASVTADDAVALIGHYLRMTANPVVDVQQGVLVGGDSWEKTESTANIANFYDWGVVSAMPYIDCFPVIATREGDMETVNALKVDPHPAVTRSTCPRPHARSAVQPRHRITRGRCGRSYRRGV